MKKKKIISVIFLSFILFLIVGFTLKQKEIHYINDTNDSEVTFAYVVDGVKSSTALKENEGYVFDSKNSGCINGTEIYWNNETWSAKIKNLKNTKISCTLSFSKGYFEKNLNGTDPILDKEMIPITFENNGIVHKADITKEWYNYANKQWANAVILKDQTKEYKNGEVIPEGNIESYFVWIPRYRYQIWDTGDYTGLNSGSLESRTQEIQIVFEDKNTIRQEGTTVGSWLSHPAFASFNTNGFWVGKFETGYEGATNTNEAQKNEKNSEKVIIKPNVYSWRGIGVANAFYTSYNYKRDLESHMMKNMEWGAIAYLAHSVYGIKEVKRYNNNSNYITGFVSNFEPSCGNTGTSDECNKYESVSPNSDGTYTLNYNNENSILTSTTGNYYGVYDMSGGAIEYVMGVMKSSATNDNPTTGINSTTNSGFNGPYSNSSEEKTDGLPWPSSKYYDLYDYDNGYISTFNRGHLGDATKELGPFYEEYMGSDRRAKSSWYNDSAVFLNSNNPWFARGVRYYDGYLTGIFAFGHSSGANSSDKGFRICRFVD